VDHYDGRAGREADLKGDKHGLGLATMRKHRLAAQKIVILLMQWAHHVLLWARRWLSKAVPRLDDYGIVRLISQVWAIPGRLKLTEKPGPAPPASTSTSQSARRMQRLSSFASYASHGRAFAVAWQGRVLGRKLGRWSLFSETGGIPRFETRNFEPGRGGK
jgi:hypothetical protein